MRRNPRADQRVLLRVTTLVIACALVALPTPVCGADHKPAGQTPSNPSADGPIVGLVVDPSGMAVAGARVTLVMQDNRTGQVTEIGMSKTDEGGRCAFARPTMDKNQRLSVWVEAPGFALTPQRLRVPSSAPVTIELEKSSVLEVRTIDEAGQPVPKVRLRPDFYSKGMMNYYQFSESIAARFDQITDERGFARFSDVARDWQMRIKIADARFAHPASGERMPRVGEDRPESVTLTLIPAASIRGQVRFPHDGRPVRGARVSAQSTRGESTGGQATTDAEGHFEIGQLRPGSVNVVVTLPAELATSWTAVAHEKVVIAKGQKVNGIDFALIPGALVTGRVAATDDGAALADAQVGVYGPAFPRSGAAVQVAMTDASGRYAMRVPAGMQYVYLMGPPPGYRSPASLGREVTVNDGETVNQDFEVPRIPVGNIVLIHVIDSEGRPVPDAEVHVNSEGRPWGWDWMGCDVNGTCRLDVEDFSQPPSVRACHGQSATAAAATISSAGELTLMLEAHALGCIRGKVVDAAGDPIASARIMLDEVVRHGGTGHEETRTGSDGAYEIRNVWPGARFSVGAAASSQTREDSKRFVLKPGETRELPTLVLKPAKLALAGRIVDRDGVPVAGLGINLHAPHTGAQEASTDRQGRFRFEGLVDESVSLYIGGETPAAISRSFQAGSAELEIMFNPKPAER